MTLEEVGPVFARINSTGTRLDVIDLLHAATWKGGFDLMEEIDQIRIAHEMKIGNMNLDQLNINRIKI